MDKGKGFIRVGAAYGLQQRLATAVSRWRSAAVVAMETALAQTLATCRGQLRGAGHSDNCAERRMQCEAPSSFLHHLHKGIEV